MNWNDIANLPPKLRESVETSFHSKEVLREEEVMTFICDIIDIPYVDLIPSQVDLSMVKLVGWQECRKLGFIPLFKHGIIHVCATYRPWSGVDISKIQQLQYDEVRVVGTTKSRLDQIFTHLEQQDEAERRKPVVVQPPPVKVIHGWGKGNDLELIQDVIRNAYHKGASDIHFEPFPDRVVIRYRINGVMVSQTPVESRYMDLVIDRVKGLAGVPTSDKRTLKDGRFTVNVGRRKSIDLRFVSLPGQYNTENIVLRLLDPDNVKKNTGKLPFADGDKELFLSKLNGDSGMVIISGPTGSGKTTTLYTALTSLNLAELKVQTVEDPIEYRLDKIVQVQVNRDHQVTFANALRYILRADPDVIMVGEIRDAETAELAASAANTGHIVLATLHTNDAVSVVTRLIDLSLTYQDVQEVLSLAIAQRLVPALCPHCKTEYAITDEEKALYERLTVPPFNLTVPSTLARALGCHSCHNTGVGGRQPIFQFFDTNPEIRALLGKRADVITLRAANAKHHPPLLVDALRWVAKQRVPFAASESYIADLADLSL